MEDEYRTRELMEEVLMNIIGIIEFYANLIYDLQLRIEYFVT